MSDGYENKSRAALALACSLKDRGWDVTNYSCGISDGMTDYFQKGRWWGVATHPDYPSLRVVASYAGGRFGDPIEPPPCDKPGSHAYAWVERIDANGKASIVETFARAKTIAREVSPYGSGKFWDNPQARDGLDIHQRHVARCVDLLTVAPVLASARAGGATLCDGTRPGYVELRFEGKPSEAVRAELKGAGFRWARSTRCWYGKAERLPATYANQLIGGDPR